MQTDYPRIITLHPTNYITPRKLIPKQVRRVKKRKDLLKGPKTLKTSTKLPKITRNCLKLPKITWRRRKSTLPKTVYNCLGKDQVALWAHLMDCYDYPLSPVRWLLHWDYWIHMLELDMLWFSWMVFLEPQRMASTPPTLLKYEFPPRGILGVMSTGTSTEIS